MAAISRAGSGQFSSKVVGMPLYWTAALNRMWLNALTGVEADLAQVLLKDRTYRPILPQGKTSDSFNTTDAWSHGWPGNGL